MQIVKRTMGWYQKPSAWQHQQSLNAKRREQAVVHFQHPHGVARNLVHAAKAFRAGQKAQRDAQNADHGAEDPVAPFGFAALMRQ